MILFLIFNVSVDVFIIFIENMEYNITNYADILIQLET